MGAPERGTQRASVPSSRETSFSVSQHPDISTCAHHTRRDSVTQPSVLSSFAFHSHSNCPATLLCFTIKTGSLLRSAELELCMAWPLLETCMFSELAGAPECGEHGSHPRCCHLRPRPAHDCQHRHPLGQPPQQLSQNINYLVTTKLRGLRLIHWFFFGNGESCMSLSLRAACSTLQNHKLLPSA